MEDEKLAAYYDDLTRRGGGAARFKQGLGFSSTASSSDAAGVPSRGSALPTASSFLSSFVRASSPSKTSEFEKQAQLQSIQNKLSEKPREKARSRSPNRNSSRRSRSPREKHSRRRSRDRHSRRRSRSRSRSRSHDRRSRRRSRSRSREYESRRKNRSRSRSRSRERNKDRSKRKASPEGRRLEKSKKGSSGAGIDYAKLIEGYDNMTPAERVKAKMKLQLSETAENDNTIGKGTGWERFEFNKDAPLDDDEIEAAEDDTEVVKNMGQSFRFSAVQAKREEKIKAAHDEAMFGGSSYQPPMETDDEAQEEGDKKQNIEGAPVASLLSNQVLMKQQGSWRDRLRKS